ncbi:MAG: mechanosensitive ion channel family protein [Faecousia sp.]
MKRNKKVIRLIVLGILTAVVFIVGYQTDTFGAVLPDADYQWNGGKILSILAMVFTTLLIENLLVLALSFLKPQRHRAKTLVALTSNMLKYAAAIIILCGVLTIVNVDITAILASLGILALIIGFGAESLIADVVTGLFILLDNQYNVGDIIEVGGFRGIVSDVGIRTTSIMDTGGNVKIINNSEMKNILNRSDNSSRAVADFSIPYETDLAALEEKIPALLEDIRRSRKDLFKAVPEYLGVQELGASAIVLRFVAEVGESDIYSGARMLNHDLLLGFRKLGVECPYQQIDVHTN